MCFSTKKIRNGRAHVSLCENLYHGTGVICYPTQGSDSTLPMPGAISDPTHKNSMEGSTFSTTSSGHLRPYLISVSRILWFLHYSKAIMASKLFKVYASERCTGAPRTGAFPTPCRSRPGVGEGRTVGYKSRGFSNFDSHLRVAALCS